MPLWLVSDSPVFTSDFGLKRVPVKVLQDPGGTSEQVA